MKIDFSDLNGLLCFNEEYEKGNEPKIKDVIIDISEITDKTHMRLDEFLVNYLKQELYLYVVEYWMMIYLWMKVPMKLLEHQDYR